MAKAQNFLAGVFSRMGRSIFRALSRWEECRFLPGAARWLKLGVLGIVASLVVSLSVRAEEPKILCYVVARFPEAGITDVTLAPNPTQGADSVSVRATASVTKPDVEGNYILSARLRRDDDTTWIPMHAADSVFDGTTEELEASLYVGDLEACTTWIYINVNTSQNGWGNESTQLIVTPPEEKED